MHSHFTSSLLAAGLMFSGAPHAAADTPLGSVSESASLAGIVEGGTANRQGIESINSFDLSDDGLVHTITWEITAWDAQGSSGARRIGLDVKSFSSSLPTPADTSLLTISIDDGGSPYRFNC
ncbi:MAG: hypothetical protein ACQCXQ_09105 [Verrucomicrobiales bacterium]|nr:hypothetical protein [Verrucomicrobiota bacterium JB025]